MRLPRMRLPGMRLPRMWLGLRRLLVFVFVLLFVFVFLFLFVFVLLFMFVFLRLLLLLVADCKHLSADRWQHSAVSGGAMVVRLAPPVRTRGAAAS